MHRVRMRMAMPMLVFRHMCYKMASLQQWQSQLLRQKCEAIYSSTQSQACRRKDEAATIPDQVASSSASDHKASALHLLRRLPSGSGLTFS
jgi:hypothetical protein